MKRIINPCLFAFFLVAFIFSSCFLQTKKEIKILEELIKLEGSISIDRSANSPLFVFLYQEKEGQKELLDYRLLKKPGPFFFYVEGGTYFIAAFEDANRDFIYQKNEVANNFGKPTPIKVKPGEDKKNLNFKLNSKNPHHFRYAVNFSHKGENKNLRLTRANLGVIKALSNPIFTPENAHLGLWKPVSFLSKIGGGVFFLKPYQKGKIPVLFIHGIQGTPRIFTTLIESLDEKRFQPWVLYYASGINIEPVARFLTTAVHDLNLRFHFNEITILPSCQIQQDSSLFGNCLGKTSTLFPLPEN